MGVSAIGPVFAYLTAGPLATALRAADPDVIVQDGWVSNVADDLFVVGRADPNDSAISATAAEAHIELGALSIEERFEIPCYIDVYRGGDDQSEARIAALAIFNAFVSYIQGDLSLGNAVNRYAEINSVQIYPTMNDQEAESGRRSVILLSLSCRNKYQP